MTRDPEIRAGLHNALRAVVVGLVIFAALLAAAILTGAI